MLPMNCYQQIWLHLQQVGIARELCYHETSHTPLIPEPIYHRMEYQQLSRDDGERLAQIAHRHLGS